MQTPIAPTTPVSPSADGGGVTATESASRAPGDVYGRDLDVVEAVDADIADTAQTLGALVAVLAALTATRGDRRPQLPRGVAVVYVEPGGRPVAVTDQLVETAVAAGDDVVLSRVREAVLEAARGQLREVEVHVSTAGAYARRLGAA